MPEKCLLPPTWSKWRCELTSVVTSGRREAGELELRRDRLLRRLLGELERQHGVRVLEVEARVEEEEPVVVLDEHGVRRDPHLRARDVPHELRVLDDDRAVVEQPDLHRVASSASSALRTATSFAARSAAEPVDLLGRVVVHAAARLHAELALGDPVPDRRRDLARRGEVLVEVRADGVVDVEAGHVEQLHRADHGELVADAPADVEVESLRVDDAAVDEVEALAQDRVEDAVLDEAGHLLLDHRVVADRAERGRTSRRRRPGRSARPGSPRSSGSGAAGSTSACRRPARGARRRSRSS